MTDGERKTGLTGGNPGESTGFLDFAILWQRKWYLVLSLLTTVSLGAAYLARTTPTYEAEARVLVQKVGMLEGVRPVLDDNYFLATQAEIIWSPVTVRRALKSLPASLVPGDSNTDPVSRVLRSLSVSPVDDTNVLKIAMQGPDPRAASRLVNAVIESYTQYLNEAELQDNDESVRLLSTRAKQLGRELQSLRQEYALKRKGSPLIGKGENAINVQIAKLQKLGTTLSDTQNRRLGLENTLQVAKSHGRRGDFPQMASTSGSLGLVFFTPTGDQPPTISQPSPTISQPSPTVSRMFGAESEVVLSDPARIEAQLMAARSRRAELAQQYGPRHPDMRAINEQIAWWEKCLEASREAGVTASTREVEVLKLNESQLAEFYDREMDATKVLDGYLLEEQDLQARIKSEQDSYQSVFNSLTRAQLAGQALSEGRSSTVVQVLERPEMTESQVWPKPVQFLGVCAMIGLVGGCLLVSVLELRKQSLYCS